MSIPNYRSVVEDLRNRYPQEWAVAHTSHPQTEAFIRRLAWVLHQQDANVGLNGKRGNPNDLSDDCVCYRGAGGQSVDVRTGQRVAVIDVITAAGSAAASPAWGEVWDPANIPTSATWVQPQPVDETAPGPSPGPTPTPQPTPQPQPPPTIDLSEVLAKLAGIEAVLIGMGIRLDTIEGLSTQAASEALNAAVRASELLARPTTDQWPEYVGTVTLPGLLGGQRTITMRPQER